jgi:hypothetical protein
MTPPLQLLIYRLTERGVSPDHIPGLIRNVLRITSTGGMFTTRLVNTQLEQLGWGSEVLDENCFQLIIHILESEWGYRVRHYSPDSMELTTRADLRRLVLSIVGDNNNQG